MKRLFTILSAAVLVLMAGSCINEQLTVFNQTDADAPVLLSDYTLLPNLAKWTLTLLMLAGRLELFALVAIFSPSYWRRGY